MYILIYINILSIYIIYIDNIYLKVKYIRNILKIYILYIHNIY